MFSRNSRSLSGYLRQHKWLARPTWQPTIMHQMYLTSHRLSDHYAFVKPNDRRALDLMNAAAVEVMKDLPDLCIAYGVSDEYRFDSSFFTNAFPEYLFFLTWILQLCLPPELSALRKTKCVSQSFLLPNLPVGLHCGPLIEILNSENWSQPLCQRLPHTTFIYGRHISRRDLSNHQICLPLTDERSSILRRESCGII